jgi:hypothetical protein
MSLLNETYIVQTPTCTWCGKDGIVEVPAVGFFARQLGAAIQDAYPDLHKSLREQLMTGYHPECWTEMFSEECHTTTV